MAEILAFRPPLALPKPSPLASLPEPNVDIAPILKHLAHADSREEARRLFKVAVNGLFVNKILNEPELEAILTSMGEKPLFRSIP